ncbi:hypothetical protein V7S43_000409 [Phytophthora oleae]|uniref:Multiple myeloma tumor-associated protein 2-like N-terminal domain-containing protein n=2 Tax=Phytophthora oleae TaxID=2107226 RepID=A0ABD3G5M0_9STRA
MSFGKTNYRVGGTRGGADQFKWEDVKNDKYRENYLGHSVQAPVGRWQKGKDLAWYAKANKSQRAEVLQAELALAKQRDEDLMNGALGIAPKKRHEPTGGLSASEMKELLKRGEAERDGLNVERVEGLGAAPVDAAGFETGPKRTLAERYKDQLGKADTTYALPGTINERMTESEAKAARKEARKAEKEAKKLKKKEKKERKKEKKAKRHREIDSEEEVEEKEHRHRHQHRKDEKDASRSRSPPRISRDAARRSRSASRQHRSGGTCSRSRSPADRRRHESSPRRPRGRSRSPGSSSRYRHHRHRSSSLSPAPRRRSRSRSRRRY